MFCNKCGAQLADGSKFCSRCGNSLISGAPQSVQPTSGGFASGAQPPYQSFGAQPYMQGTDPMQFNQYPYPVKKKGGCLKWILIVGGIILLVALAIVFLFGLFGDGDDGGHEINSPNSVSNNGYANSFNYNTNYDYELGGVSATPMDVPGLRAKYTDTANSESVTLMIYMLASDLESNGGFATADLSEMEEASFGENINVIIQTGGTSYWDNTLMTDGTCERWQLVDDGFVLLEDIGMQNMASPRGLTDFITYAASNFPADRYALVLWDHGGGTMWGYGYDENFPNDSIDLHEMDNALSNAGIKFDFVGFDACLMSTLEVAYMMENHADYLIASEETEPGCGWYYTNWLAAFDENPQIDTVELAKLIIDDYIYNCNDLDYESAATLSVVDLREIPYAYDMVCDFLEDSEAELNNYHYDIVSRARSDAKDYGEGEYQQIDIADLAYRLSVEGADEVIDAIKSAVKYRNQTDNMRGSHGLAMYFPYTDYEYFNYVSDLQRAIGIGDEYTGFFELFLNVMMSGNLNRENASQYDWYDDSIVSEQESEENYDVSEYEDLIINENANGDFVLELTDEQWNSLTSITLEALLDDGEGYIDLGIDNVWTCDDDGNLIVEFDYTWVTINGQTVPFFFEYEYDNGDDDWYTYGSVPITLDGEYCELVVYWGSSNPGGYVAGYRPYYDENGVANKGIIPIPVGAEIQVYFYYYNNYEFDDEDIEFVNLYEPIIMTEAPLEVSYSAVDSKYDALIWYSLTDIYQNEFYTESVIYSD